MAWTGSARSSTSAGVPAKVYRWEAVEWAYRDIMKSRPEAVMIMGHSMGALATITLANKLKGSGIRVAYIGTIDIPGPTAITPANAEVAENYYHAFPVFGQLATPRGHAGTVKNELVWGQVHITMDKSKVVHSAALSFVSRARGAEGTMQAYSPEATQGEDVIAQVDTALTGSTSAAPTAESGLTEEASTSEPAKFAARSNGHRTFRCRHALPATGKDCASRRSRAPSCRRRTPCAVFDPVDPDQFILPAMMP